MKKKFHIFSNRDGLSNHIEEELVRGMNAAGYEESENRDDADIIFCIGGDGALLRLLHEYRFPQALIVGINTGHLGFFQEITPDGIEDFLSKLTSGDYRIQEYIGLELEIYTGRGIDRHLAINEVVVRGEGGRLMHLDILVGHANITRYSGDGILVCTPAGSTAYNYSLGGVIVDPAVDTLQITPMAPVNNIAYRSFSSGIMVPSSSSIEIRPVDMARKPATIVIEDGKVVAQGTDIEKVVVKVAQRRARIFRFSDYDFWGKVKSKIIGEN